MAKPKVIKQADKETLLYGGKVKIEFYEARHQYFATDVKSGAKTKPISVTKVTGLIDKSGPLMFWAINLAKDHLKMILGVRQIEHDDIEVAGSLHRVRKEAAADTGTNIHNWAELYIKAKLAGNPQPELPEDPQVLNGILAFLKWEEEHNVKFIESEKLLYSRKHDYVGLMDAKAVVDGKLSCIDFKTGKNIYPEHLFQTAAYQAADMEESKEKYTGPRWIVQFGKDSGEFHAAAFDNLDADYSAFLGLLDARRRLTEVEAEFKSNGK
jgi:hypothetical protein